MESEKNNVLLQEKLRITPTNPGVYLMKNALGRVIYVGKAKNLKKRVSSYFNKNIQSDIKTSVLVQNIDSFETIIASSELEALIIESSLIKRYRPKYNVILKDDKRYPSICIDIHNEYPTLKIVRKIENDGSLYFGPFTSGGAVGQTLKFINKTFKLRKCKIDKFVNRSRPCLNYQMNTCLGPCCLDVNKEKYRKIVNEVILFLKGKAPELAKNLKQDMIIASNEQRYEDAAQIRDRFFAIQKILEKQIAVTNDFIDRDVFAVAGDPKLYVVSLLQIRSGALLGTRHFGFKDTILNDTELLETFLRQYYEKTGFVPDEILTHKQLEDSFLIEQRLKEFKNKKVSLICPVRGDKTKLLTMAFYNAKQKLKELSKSFDINILDRLEKRLMLFNRPIRIECFDNSTFAGTNTVAGMVVFDHGIACKSLYKKYKIDDVKKPDDYACMAEVIKQRYLDDTMPYPDLIMVDGGKGQLNITYSIIKELGLSDKIDVISIAKKDKQKGETADKIYKYARSNPINFNKESDLLLFLQRIRDEAHNFAISCHRNQRGKKATISELDLVKGIGKKRKIALLDHFKTISNIKNATIDEIISVPGINKSVANELKKSIK